MDELQMMMLIKTLVPIIAIFIIVIYLVYALTKKNKENPINKDGIRIKYNNEFIKKNYYEYLVEKYGKEKADQIDLNTITQNNMMEMCKEKALQITDFTENDMLITWDAIESWDGYLKDADVIGARTYYNTSLKYI